MQNYSDNWRHLKSLLCGYSNGYSLPEDNSFESHQNAKAIALFLAHSSLFTPKLDRASVEAILTGILAWPKDGVASNFTGVNLPIEFFERNGFISFYADWLSIHCSTVRHPESLDDSLVGLVSAIKNLKNIKYGRDGYLRPFYSCSESTLRTLFIKEFGTDNVSKLIPKMVLKNNKFELHPNDQKLDSQVSTYLWQALVQDENTTTEEAFATWMLCMRTYCDWCFPVQFTGREGERASEFKDQLLQLIEKDVELNNDLGRLVKQSINTDHFELKVLPVATTDTRKRNFTDNSSTSTHVDKELPKITLQTLETSYPRLDLDSEARHLQFIEYWLRHLSPFQHEIFYSGLLSKGIFDDIHFSYQTLSTYGFLDRLLELSEARPVLKFILFITFTQFENFEYKLALLSRHDTCDVGFYYLSQQRFSEVRNNLQLEAQNIDSAYQLLLCDAYLRALIADPDCGERLLNMFDYMGGKCSFHSTDFSNSHEYKLIICFLSKLSPELNRQLIEAFIQSPPKPIDKASHVYPDFHRYFLGFWLIENLEKSAIDVDGSIFSKLKSTLFDFYEGEFKVCVEGKRTLQPNEFFDSLPWYKVVTDESVAQLLKLSNDCFALKDKISSESNTNSYISVWAIRHYLTVLISLARSKKLPKSQSRIENRVMELVKVLGFGDQQGDIYLFGIQIPSRDYDLWPQFCAFTNQIEDGLYQDLLDRVLPRVQLDQLFVLLENTTVEVRISKLEQIISGLSVQDDDDLALKSIEDAFISAWDFDFRDLAASLIQKGRDFLDQDRIKKITHPTFVEKRKLWEVYEYKWALRELNERFKDNPDGFSEAAAKVRNPFPYAYQHSIDQGFYKECDYFRRYYTAAMFLDSNPKKSMDIMEALCKEVDAINFQFILFTARIKFYGALEAASGIKYALTHFQTKIIYFDQLRPIWITSLLHAFGLIKDKEGLQDFWSKLTGSQQERRDVVVPYCIVCRDLAEPVVALKYLRAYMEKNPDYHDDAEVVALSHDLINAAPPSDVMQVIRLTNEGMQRNIQQLRVHYSQIVAKDFVTYLDIIKPGMELHDYLKEIVLEIANELLLRKKNLQIHSEDKDGNATSRVTKEDLINDWFTSLFEKRLAEAKVSFKDQKRAGESGSAKEPGRTDGLICNSKGNRIAIFEAFRLNSLTTSTIDEHLNKISTYDNEGLSPVFIVVYCEIGNFSEFITKYETHVAGLTYKGFKLGSLPEMTLKMAFEAPNLHLFKEVRNRGSKEIVIYHLLLNLS